MKQYKIAPNGFNEIKRQSLVRTIPIMLLAAGIGIAISSLNSKNKASDINTLPIVIPVVVVVLGFSLYRGINKQKGLYDSYTLTLTNNLITREQLNTPTVSIYFNDIREIVKNKNGSFTIRGKEKTDLIGIPAQIEQYSELEMSLNQIMPIASTSVKSTLQKYGPFLSVLVLGLMFCVYALTNKVIVVCSGTLLTGILLWSAYEIRTSKNIDVKTKRIGWWILLVLASVIAVTIMKLTGYAKQ